VEFLTRKAAGDKWNQFKGEPVHAANSKEIGVELPTPFLRS
jgi:hypothetical protein